MRKSCCLIFFCLMSVSFSAIHFVDADLTNTTIDGQSLSDGVNYVYGSNSIIDDLWGDA